MYRAISAQNCGNTKKQLGGAILGCSEDLLASVVGRPWGSFMKLLSTKPSPITIQAPSGDMIQDLKENL